MKKRLMLALLLILCAVLLASCGEGKRYEVKSNNNGGTQTQQTPAETAIPEEEPWEAPELPTQAPVTPTPAPTAFAPDRSVG